VKILHDEEKALEQEQDITYCNRFGFHKEFASRLDHIKSKSRTLIMEAVNTCGRGC
jgi:hypothetical protein